MPTLLSVPSSIYQEIVFAIPATAAGFPNAPCPNVPFAGQFINPCLSAEVAVELTNDGTHTTQHTSITLHQHTLTAFSHHNLTHTLRVTHPLPLSACLSSPLYFPPV